MGYAKQLGKQYNAESAWSSLGSPKGWQDYYDIAAQAPKYQRLYSRLSKTFTPPNPSSFAENYNNDALSYFADTRNKFSNAPTAIGLNQISNVFGNIQQFPQALLGNAMAGRYAKFL